MAGTRGYDQVSVPSFGKGLCQCGCGGKTTIAKHDYKRLGHVKGEPVRFLVGHGCRKSPFEYVEKDAGYTTPCWVWQRAMNPDGYGIAYRNGKTCSAHRAIYKEQVGPIPVGLELDHLCRNHPCVNPEHLEPVTKTENKRRSPHCKLTIEDARSIRASNESGPELALRFGVSGVLVSLIRRGLSWREEAA